MAPAANDSPARPQRHLPGAGTRKRLVGGASDLVSGGAGLLGRIQLTLALATWRRRHTTCANPLCGGGIPGLFALGDKRPFTRRGSRASVGRDCDITDRGRGGIGGPGYCQGNGNRCDPRTPVGEPRIGQFAPVGDLISQVDCKVSASREPPRRAKDAQTGAPTPT